MTAYVCAQSNSLWTQLRDGFRTLGQTDPIRCQNPAEMRDFVDLASEKLPVTLCLGPPWSQAADEGARLFKDLAVPGTFLVIGDRPPPMGAVLTELPGSIPVDFLQIPADNDSLLLRLRLLLATAKLQADQLVSRQTVRHLMTRTASANPATKIDQDSGLPVEAEILSALALEWRRCMRYDWPLAFLVLAIDPPLANSTLKRKLGTLLAGITHRPGDTIGHFRGGLYAAVLSETDPAGAQHVALRLRDAFIASGIKNAGTSTRIRIGMACEHPGDIYRHLQVKNETGPEVLIAAAGNACQRATLEGLDLVQADFSGGH